jgi:hypothetical protein
MIAAVSTAHLTSWLASAFPPVRDPETCDLCGGTGELPCPACDGSGLDRRHRRCGTCGGQPDHWDRCDECVGHRGPARIALVLGLAVEPHALRTALEGLPDRITIAAFDGMLCLPERLPCDPYVPVRRRPCTYRIYRHEQLPLPLGSAA